jgi:hypothetical protein
MDLSFDARFVGVPDLILGGYVAGTLARRFGGAAEVSLRGPIRPGRALRLVETAGAVELFDGETLLADGRPAGLDIVAPPAPTLAAATAASRDYLGFHHHLFPGCFCCGPARVEGDGLRIFAGPLSGTTMVAAPWTPHPSVASDDRTVHPEVVWAAFDCPQLWALIANAPEGSEDKGVTGRMVSKLLHPVIAGEPHIVVGWPIGKSGRKAFAGAAIYKKNGQLCALSQQTTIVTSQGVPLSHKLWKA